MLMHTRGILVMVPEAAMVLTGKTALDYSGSVSAEDNLGIGGYERIMGPNGQAQYWARDLRRRPAGSCSATTSTPTSRPASASRGGPRPAIRARATCAVPARRRGNGFALVGESSATRGTPGARSRSTSAA